MLILKRQDVEIANVQIPQREQPIPILSYQGQQFRLISVFSAKQEDEARSFWRDLTDNQGKFCILLEEPERYSIWGRVKGSVGTESETDSKIAAFTQACLLLLQAVYFDIEDMLGNRQAKLFEKDIANVFQQWHFPKTEGGDAVSKLMALDPLAGHGGLPPWEEHHLITLLQELYRLGKEYFGNTTFAEGMGEVLGDMSHDDLQQFRTWLNKSPLGKQWQ